MRDASSFPTDRRIPSSFGDRIAIEVKGASRPRPDHLQGLRELRVDQPQVKKRILACLEHRPRRTEDGIDILPVRDLLARLWDGDVIK